MVKNYRINVLGKVQGVWFRKYTEEAALSYHVRGIVKNEIDGSVYIEAEGEEKDLNSFLQWLQKGSPLSTVEQVKWEEGLIKGFAGFKISR